VFRPALAAEYKCLTGHTTLTTLTDWIAASPRERARALDEAIARIRETDESIRAWVQVSVQPFSEGPLAGIPFGVKDIIETRGLATEYGSPIYRGRLGTEDAAIVRQLRELGAVLIGKTQTTAFAWRTPAPTRNPRNIEHTPGGSSSGSAAAVAAGIIPIALGTQTLGSVLRPASFCGVTGFKPTYGVLPTEGVLPCAPTLDTLGLFTHRAEDMAALWRMMEKTSNLANHESPIKEQRFAAPVILPDAEPVMAAAFQHAIGTLRRSGVSVVPIDIAAELVRLGAAARVVLAYEASRVHDGRFREYGDRLQDMADLVREGQAIPPDRYAEALDDIAGSKLRMSRQFESTPVILVPSAAGPAPLGLASTGDPVFNAPWTALGTPAISIPMKAEGLPLGLQLTADRGHDAALLEAAVAMERLLRAS
jgi:Asp-tRNA(Asn)/Glu-tRNA(Gln) amidotransferase A subunit family amidase